MMIHEELNFNDKLTEKQKKMLEALKTRPVTPDEDCPELTDEQIRKFANQLTASRKNINSEKK